MSNHALRKKKASWMLFRAYWYVIWTEIKSIQVSKQQFQGE
jgi:hypothetical protein